MKIKRKIGNMIRAGLAVALMTAVSAVQAVTVDLLVLYDGYSANYFNNQPETAMQNWVTQINNAYQDSQVDVQLRLVGVMPHEEAGSDMGAVLENLRVDEEANNLRNQLGADFVTQIHQQGSCGIAYFAVASEWAWGVVGPDCGPMTMAHELGHNMGLAHSRRQGDESGTRYRYGLGHGVDQTFGSIMTYHWLFDAPRVSKFSNPRITCNGEPCGVEEGQPDEADAAKAIQNIRGEIAEFRPTTISGGSSSTLLSRVSDKCVDVSDRSTDNYANIVQWDCWGGDNQQFEWKNLGNGYHQLVAQHSGKCIRVSDGDVYQYDCHDNYWSEMFERISSGSGYYILKNRGSGSCLRVENSSVSNGANIVLASCDTGWWSQHFSFE
ncbi:RICIN domain-containing protein [Microbulbifer rhizosphaerae]|uniref:Ricin B lectin domain-containing protein n=1 Tax=Microbulbifer rhizosphaerae TaxID=1562603 RepID=A0A7W4ZAB6_9GAMM|nr:RICIN domain-containing protein [Microbulbifer rhizosphaerae]MBB3061169.1 hypothetical protein [Microbulbifer rhizosphaerae]